MARIWGSLGACSESGEGEPQPERCHFSSETCYTDLHSYQTQPSAASTTMSVKTAEPLRWKEQTCEQRYVLKPPTSLRTWAGHKV